MNYGYETHWNGHAFEAVLAEAHTHCPCRLFATPSPSLLSRTPDPDMERLLEEVSAFGDSLHDFVEGVRALRKKLNDATNIIMRLSDIDDDTSLDGAPVDGEFLCCLFCRVDAEYVGEDGLYYEVPFADHEENCPWVAAFDFLRP